MNKLAVLAGTALAFCFVASPSFAQATRTWVSGVGDDANPCSRTAPCKTFAGAISKTAPGGEISVLDPGGFGAVTITKSITLDGDGTLASILNAGGVNGIIVAAGAADGVVIRSLSINGAGTGLNGIRFLSGASLTVENTTIQSQTGNGIEVAPSGAGGNLFLNNVTFVLVNKGIRFASPVSGASGASIRNTRFFGGANGVSLEGGNAFVSIIDSQFASHTNASVSLTGLSSSRVSVSNSLITNSVIGVNSAVSGGEVRADSNELYDNANAFSLGAGANLRSDGNNKVGPGQGVGVPNQNTSKL
jgi:hypothetical protein